MRWRLAGVLVLTLFAVGVRGTSIYLRYLSTELSSEPPFSTHAIGADLVVSHAKPNADCYRSWQDPARPQMGDRILAVYDFHGRGGEVRGLFDYGLYLRPINVEEPWTLVVNRPGPRGAERLALAMPPSVPITWSAAEWIESLSADFYLPFLATMTGLLIGLLRWRNDQAWLASLLFISLGLVVVPSLSQFPQWWRVAALCLQVSALQLLPYLVFRFFLRFPSRSPVDRALPWLNPVLAAETAVAWVVGLAYQLARHLSLSAAARMETAFRSAGVPLERLGTAFTAFAGLMLVAALVSVAFSVREARSRDEQRRLRIIAVGAVCGLLPALLMFGAASAGTPVPMWLLLVSIPLIGLFPLSFAYAVVRHRVFGIRVMVRRGLTYALVSRGFLIAEAAIIFVALLGVSGTMLKGVEPQPSPAASTAGTAVATFMLTLGMRRVNRRVLPVIDRRFFRDAYDGRRILNDLSRAVRRMASHPEQLLSHASGEVMSALHPRGLAIFVSPDACARLTPLGRSGDACCEIDVGEQGRKPFLLFVAEADPADAGRRARVDRVFVTRLSLGRHLAACAAGEPEALEVEVFETTPAADGLGRLASDPADPPGPDPAPCIGEARLLARFDARLVVPLVTAGRVIGFLLLGEKRSEEPYSREDKELLLTVAEQMAIALDYAQLIGQAAEQAALRREIQIAQQVQRQLFPHERPPLHSLRYAGVCRAARGVGGDFYDFLPLASGRLGIALADIAGKGLPAALLMASLQALLRSHAPACNGALQDLARELNRHLVETSDGARFATLFFGVYDDQTRLLQYVNAGHLPPLVLTPLADGRLDVKRLDSGGMVLGLFPDQDYSKGCARLSAGDRLLVFSDGITEAEDPSGEAFGEQRLVAAVSAFHGDIEHLPEHVMGEVERFVGPSPQQDDITVIAAEVS
jgi:sigma-B regulation protein RsbU (phosphoserine phosphatase)